MGQRLLWASTVAVPVAVAADLAGLGASLVFVLSALALVPMAWLIGESTEQVGEHTGPAVAALVNASFGNAPEVMVSLFALSRGLADVVRGSLTGSIVGNLLLVLGFSLLFGGGQPVRRRVVFVPLALVAAGIGGFLVPSALHWSGASDATVELGQLAPLALLLLAYVVITARQTTSRLREHRASAPETGGWSLPRAMGTLAAATAATAVVTEILTGTIQQFSASTGLGQFFTAAVVVAVVGNAAEHGGAVVLAARGKLELAAGIAVSSAAQVALFVVPLVVFASYGLQPLPLRLRPVEVAALAVGVALPAVLLLPGRGRRWHGPLLCAAYAAVAAGFWAAG